MFFKKDAKIVLFKTPLDSNYKNVYDDYANKATYISFLEYAFYHINITLSNNKSVRDRDGYFSLVISGYNSIDLHDYNYMLSYNENNIPIFSFILSVDSNNDNTSGKACTLNCKLDTWSNHYLELKNYNNRQTYKRGTFNLLSTEYKYMPIKAVDIPKSPITSIQRLSAGNRNFTIMWLHIVMSPNINTKCYLYDHDHYTELGTSRKPCIPSLPFDIYVPCAIFEKDSIKPIKEVVLLASQTGLYPHEVGGDTEYDETLIRERFEIHNYVILPKLNSSKIYDAEFTFYAPFTYTIEYDGTEPVSPNEPRYIIWANGDSVHVSYSYDSDAGIFGYCNHNAYLIESPTGTITSVAQPYTTPITQSARYNISIANIINSEQQTYQYPYKYDSYIYNGKETYSSAENGWIKGFDIHIGLRNQPTIIPTKWDTSENETYEEIGENLSSNGEIPTAVSSYDEYMNQQANRHSLRMINALLSTGKGLTNNHSWDVKRGFTTFLDIYAQEEDLKNAPYAYSKTDFADSDIYYQNEVFRVTRDYCVANEAIKRRIIDDHYNGVTVNGTVKSIFSKERDMFDVDEISDCKINGILSDNDRKELNSAFNSGVTRWHVGNIEDLVRLDFIITLNKHVTNLYVSLLS